MGQRPDELEAGRVYWIRLTKPQTLQLAVPASTPPQAPAPQSSVDQIQFTPQELTPPATYYGTVTPGSGQAPSDNEEVIAFIEEVECGRTSTTRDQQSGELRYFIKVNAANASNPGCGAPDRKVTFKNTRGDVLGNDQWNNSQPRPIELRW